MDSRITASIEFYFKGEKFTFSEEIDLETWLNEHQCELEPLYDILANRNGLDRYRYEYDVMVMEPIYFSHATGLAAKYTHDGNFDADVFIKAREQLAVLSHIQSIAKKHLGIESLADHAKLKAALLDAYYHTNKP